MSRILIIEDDPDIALGLQEDLARHGHDTDVARDGEAGLRRARDGAWDVILLDVMLPLRDGFEVCRELRRLRVKTPVIMLTARTQEAEKVLGLEVGADDYVTKPFSAAELRARIKAVTRRFADDDDSAGTYRFGQCEVDFDRAELRRAGVVVDVTALELRLLRVFSRSRGRVLTREQLIRQAWGDNVYIGDRVVDTHILNLRKKVEAVPTSPQHIRSVRGIGYRFDG
ncbi:DNA-binding response regulator [Luteitalea sp. TBR-22]|uniref:response regulator transcription factor n=1 Tax=Luteitalea sp. TBR-22 TaxID=2802971 RepID=UPI001AF41964|nr:response regulator transcription factor [Luteitalea sp. TBR-22]BCS35731.1 DNA-binding response regulator [Luteitalea sp. TBR-22]